MSVLEMYYKFTQKKSDRFFGKIRGNIKIVKDAYWSKKNFQTEHRRPVLAKDVETVENNMSYKNVAIVIQGPIIEKHNFTLETVKLYKKLFKDCKIILSTWDNNKAEVIKSFENHKIEVLTLKQPTGGVKENFQIVSTYEGILRAEKLGCNFVMKTRSDQRIYAEDCLTFFFDLLKMFPLKVQTKAHNRIITMNLNTFKKRCYGITDMWLFGHITDMKLYWNSRIKSKNDMLNYWENEQIPKDMDSNWRVVETYLCSTYLKKIKYEFKWSLDFYYKCVADMFIIIDKEMIDLLWPKYTSKEYRWINYDKNFVFKQINFKDWVKLWKENN